jgi:CMP-N-acetylneuraminic acid synthetase
MRILALVPARGGSKRLPGKNIRPLGGKPLIAWTLDPALRCGLFCDVLLSTDDEAIAAAGRQCGALVPWLRPPELASDTASSVDAALHAVDWYESRFGELDGVMLLQPTSPFRTEKSIAESIALFRAGSGSPVVSVTPAPSHPAWTFYLNDGVLTPFLDWAGMEKRSQDLAPAFVNDGSIYIISPKMLRARRSFMDENTKPYLIDNPRENLDIDSQEDWDQAEKMLEGLKG